MDNDYNEIATRIKIEEIKIINIEKIKRLLLKF